MENKNIWLLPTDKPSRLGYLTKKGKEVFKNLILFDRLMPNILDSENQNIYITSDFADINVNHYIITKDGRLVQVSYFQSKDLQGALKVILTTDQDLIKDGVQAIDDEFLEWFVKNPSCERVEVEIKSFFNGFLDPEYASPKYKYKYIIIIPKEAPIQETSLEEAILQILIENSVWEKNNVPYDTFYKVVNSMNQWLNGKNKECIASMKLEDVKQETSLEEFINSQPKLGTKEFNDLASAFFGGNPKQETLEEFAKVEAIKQYSEDTFGNLVVRKSIEKGAKWQQEQQDDYALDFVYWLMDNCQLITDSETQENVLWRYNSEDYTVEGLLKKFKNK